MAGPLQVYRSHPSERAALAAATQAAREAARASGEEENECVWLVRGGCVQIIATPGGRVRRWRSEFRMRDGGRIHHSWRVAVPIMGRSPITPANQSA